MFGCIPLFAILAPAQTALPAGVDVRLEAAPRKATVGDLIQIDIFITTPQSYKIEIPQTGKQLGDFAILEFSSVSVKAERGGALLQHSTRIIAAAYKTGKIVFPPLRIILVDNAGKQTELSSPPTAIEIQSVINLDRGLKDLKKQAELPESRWLLWLALVLAAVILLFICRRFWKSRQASSPPPATIPGKDALEVAESDLRALLARGIPASGEEKIFYVRISEIVKRILELGYLVVTAERTSLEILESLCRSPSINQNELDRIQKFLLECDAVKFAKYVPSMPEHQVAIDGAFAILANVQETRTRRSAVGIEK
jgi:hypothetical protein